MPQPISGITTPTPFTLVFHLTQPVGALVAGALVLPLSAPVPQSYASPFDHQDPSTYFKHEVATGPYMVANSGQGALTGYKPNVSILLVRNPNWRKSTDHRPAYRQFHFHSGDCQRCHSGCQGDVGLQQHG